MILDKIIKQTIKDLEAKKTKIPFSDLAKLIDTRKNIPARMTDILKKNAKSKTYNVICEVKKASPSKGVIREDFNPIDIAMSYDKNGASCISVLTEEHFFQGSLEYLKNIDEVVQTPLLRKDFIVDKYQILEAYINGADMILLIAKVLDVNTMKLLFEYTKELGMSALVEVHDKEDLEKALEINADIIGVNHRNLDDFTMDMELCIKLLPFIPQGKIVIAESGITQKDTMKKLDALGVDAFLIGEHFMRSDTQDMLCDFISKNETL